MKNKNEPIRMCIGCRGKFPQNILIRFVCNNKQTLECEGIKKLPGRGAYICYSEPCIEKAFNVPKRINALLRVQLSKSDIHDFKQALLKKEIK